MLCAAAVVQAGITGGYYWLDGESEARELTVASGSFTLDVSHLADGMHTIYWTARDDQGRLSAPVGAHFYLDSNVPGQMTPMIALDNADEPTKLTSMSVAGRQTLSLDMSTLADGMHTIRLVFTSRNGVVTMATGHFDKQHIGPKGVTDYAYWVNSNTTRAISAHLDKPTFLIHDQWALPEADDFKTTSFGLDFETDGTPVAISSNQLGVMVRNDAGRADFAFATFGDSRVKRTVDVIQDITGGGEFRHAGPTGAAILWYTFTATAGDSVALQTDRSCSMRLFDPKGQELLYTTGTASTTARGLVVNRAGTYYVALHDATSTSTVTLKFLQQSAPGPRGDADGNGVVDIDDINIIINIMVGKAKTDDHPKADADGNGVVDIDDLNIAINVIVRKD